MIDSQRLREYDEDEWRDVVRSLRPEWTDEYMDEKWLQFLEWLRRREMH